MIRKEFIEEQVIKFIRTMLSSEEIVDGIMDRLTFEDTQSTVIINKEIIIEALTNFDSLFEEATNEEKRALLRALIKEIHVETDRKSIKNIVFWFAEDDGLAQAALPVNEERRTVSQVMGNRVSQELIFG